jgi:hypothetical protein
MREMEAPNLLRKYAAKLVRKDHKQVHASECKEAALLAAHQLDQGTPLGN